MQALPPVATTMPSAAEAVSQVQLQKPSDADSAAFSSAASGTGPTLNVEAQPALPQGGLMDGVETRLNSLSHAMDSSSDVPDAGQMDTSVTADVPSAAGADASSSGSSSSGATHGKAFDDSEFRQAFGSLQKTYGFSIEAQLASNGASSSTKVFNDLLKGQ